MTRPAPLRRMGPLAALALLSACSPLMLTSAPASLVVAGDTAVLAPVWLTAVYTSNDPNNADIYLSDLPIDVLTAEDPSAIDSYAGSIIHIHYFLTPKAGRTPIDTRAANTTIQHLVLVPNPSGGLGFAGLYGGGGFLLPNKPPGRKYLSGTIGAGSHALLNAGPGFEDRLGNAVIEGAIDARLDDGACMAIARNLSMLKRERLAE